VAGRARVAGGQAHMNPWEEAGPVGPSEAREEAGLPEAWCSGGMVRGGAADLNQAREWGRAQARHWG
jgi:hypothetical protein